MKKMPMGHHPFLEKDILELPENLTLDEAIRTLKEERRMALPRKADAGYLYVTTAENHLAGVIQMRDLILEPGSRRLGEIMKKPVVSIKETMTQPEMLALFRRHRFLALPVVSETGRLLGAVRLSRVAELLEKEAGATLYQATGINPEELSHRSILKMVMLRSPWLLLSILSGLVAAFILGNYFLGIETIISLILFIPIVLGLSGSMARQCAVMVTQEFSRGSISLRKVFEIMAKELLLAIFSGLLTLAAVGIVAIALQKSLLIALAVGAAITAAIFLSGALGVFFPFLFAGLRVDPKIACGPFTVAVCDLFALWTYLHVAYFFLSRYFKVV